MAAPDVTEWKRAGYLPASDAARAVGVPPMTLHRHMDAGEIPFKRQGRYYRFVRVADMVAWVRGQYADKQVAASIIRKVRAAGKIRREA